MNCDFNYLDHLITENPITFLDYLNIKPSSAINATNVTSLVLKKLEKSGTIDASVLKGITDAHCKKFARDLNIVFCGSDKESKISDAVLIRLGFEKEEIPERGSSFTVSIPSPNRTQSAPTSTNSIEGKKTEHVNEVKVDYCDSMFMFEE